MVLGCRSISYNSRYLILLWKFNVFGHVCIWQKICQEKYFLVFYIDCIHTFNSRKLFSWVLKIYQCWSLNDNKYAKWKRFWDHLLLLMLLFPLFPPPPLAYFLAFLIITTKSSSWWLTLANKASGVPIFQFFIHQMLFSETAGSEAMQPSFMFTTVQI